MVYTDIGRFGKNMLEVLFPEGLKNVNHDVFVLSMWGFPVLGGSWNVFRVTLKAFISIRMTLGTI